MHDPFVPHPTTCVVPPACPLLILKALLSRAARGTFQPPPPPLAPSVQIWIPTVPTPSSGMGDLGFVRALGVVPNTGLSRRTCPARSRGMQTAGLGEGAQRGGGEPDSGHARSASSSQAAGEGGPRRQTSRISAVTSRGQRQQCRSASFRWCSRCSPWPAGAAPGQGPHPEHPWINPPRRRSQAGGGRTPS